MPFTHSTMVTTQSSLVVVLEALVAILIVIALTICFHKSRFEIRFGVIVSVIGGDIYVFCCIFNASSKDTSAR